jgi:hypothetical protein
LGEALAGLTAASRREVVFDWVELDPATVDVFPVFEDMLGSVDDRSGGSEDIVTVTVYKPRET